MRILKGKLNKNVRKSTVSQRRDYFKNKLILFRLTLNTLRIFLWFENIVTEPLTQFETKKNKGYKLVCKFQTKRDFELQHQLSD